MLNNPSKQITEFLNFLDEVKSNHPFCLECMHKQEDLTQDYLHKLEIEGLNRAERSKIATALVANRKDRRYYKDRVEELEPIVNWINDPVNKKTLDMLRQVLGQVRKAENYHKDRTYFPRVLKEKKDE